MVSHATVIAPYLCTRHHELNLVNYILKIWIYEGECGEV